VRRIFIMTLMLLMLTPASASAKNVSFIEAALYFMTAVEPTAFDEVDDYHIVLSQYPMRIYLLDSDSCIVRLRTTTKPYTFWQMKFCKITGYQWSNDGLNTAGGSWDFVAKDSDKDLFCQARLDRNDDYMGEMKMETCFAFYSGVISMDSLLNHRFPPRSQTRMMESMKYIAKILTPPAQRKPY
jgi:hypothetical protein